MPITVRGDALCYTNYEQQYPSILGQIIELITLLNVDE